MNVLMSDYTENLTLHIETLYKFDKTAKDGTPKPVSLQKQGTNLKQFN